MRRRCRRWGLSAASLYHTGDGIGAMIPDDEDRMQALSLRSMTSMPDVSSCGMRSGWVTLRIPGPEPDTPVSNDGVEAMSTPRCMWQFSLPQSDNLLQAFVSSHRRTDQ